MGARQSKRSVDITTTPKKEGAEAVGDAAAPGDGKLERIEEADTKPTTNGIAPHAEVAEDKEKDKDDATEKDKEKQQQQPEEVKAEEAKPESTGESPAETAELTTPTEATAASPNTATSPDSKETKKKDKVKKKWSFRSISFGKKDKNKPSREEAPKNGDITKEEPLAEGGEEAENGSTTADSPTEDKSGVSSPSEKEASTESAVANESKEDGSGTQSATPAASSPLEEKKEEPTPSAPTPVPVEEKKEELEKVDAEKKVVEVSRAGGQSVVVAADPVEVSVFRVQPVATPSIIERKTSEDIPSQPPSSPPPTPIDPSPLQQAHQAQATAKALAEVLKMPASEAADQTFSTLPEAVPNPVSTTNIRPESDDRCCDEINSSPVKSCCAPSEPANSSEVDEPKVEVALAPPRTEALPVVDQEKNEQSRFKVDRPDELPQTQQQDPLPPSLDTATKNPDLAPKEYPSPSKIVDTADVEVPQQIPKSRVENGEVAMKPEIKQKREVVEEQASSEVVEEKQEIIEKPEKSETVLVEDPDSKSTEGKAPIVEETFEEEVVKVVVEECPDNDKDIASTPEEKLIETVIEPVEITSDPKEEVVLESIEQPDLVIESEEGPLPVSEEEFVVEAKPAVVIPEDEVAEEVADTDADTSKVDTESIKVIELAEEKLENEMESDVAILTEAVLVVDEPEDVPPTQNGLPSEPIDETIVILEDVAKGERNIIEIAEVEDPLPPPPPESASSSPEKTPKATESVAVPSPPPPQTPPNARENLGKSPEREPTRVVAVVNEPLVEPPTSLPQSSLSEVLDVPQTVSAKGSNIANESQTHDSPSRLDEVSASSDDFPPAPVETVECTDSSDRSLPPEELSCPLTSSNVSQIKPELPVPKEEACSLRSPTEMLLTPPRSPSPRSNVSLTTKESFSSSQMQSCDELSNREFKMESTSISLNSHNESEIELEGRLAESQAEIKNEEERDFSKCHLSNSATPPATQEIHQSAPEAEAPVENHVAHDVSPTESLDEAPKVAPPAVPIEAPASPPSAPVITEDVASVTKAIEEIDISDKAVAAATIECNATEIIADAPHQNNINE